MGNIGHSLFQRAVPVQILPALSAQQPQLDIQFRGQTPRVPVAGGEADEGVGVLRKPLGKLGADLVQAFLQQPQLYPCLLYTSKEAAQKADAEEMQKKLEEVGAKVELK